MAREEEEHTQLITLLEVQAAEIQLQISTAQRQHLIQTATNEELLVGIKTKVDALTIAPPPAKISEAQNQYAQAAFKLQLGKRLRQ